MFTREQVQEIANKLNIQFNKFPFEDFYTGINIELEHGSTNPETNVTDSDLERTAKIALAHLNEFSDYYNHEYGLPALERYLEYKKDLRKRFTGNTGKC